MPAKIKIIRNTLAKMSRSGMFAVKYGAIANAKPTINVLMGVSWD